MIGFIKNLFGSGANAEKVVSTAADGIYNGLDKLVYTEEEKADALAKGRELFIEFARIAYDQNSIRSVTRRWLAFMVVGPFTLFSVLSVGFWVAGMNGVADKVADLSSVFSGPSMVVLAFYFGPHILGSLKKKE